MLPGAEAVDIDVTKQHFQHPGYSIDAWVLATEPGMVVPAVLFVPDDADNKKPVTVYLGADRTISAAGGIMEKRVKAGESVVRLDLRGMGETVPNAGKPGSFGPDHVEAFLALHLNRPLLGQRVFDVLQALRAVSIPGAEIHLIATGPTTSIALHAALFDERIKSIEIENTVISWSSVARTRTTHSNLADVVPGALLSYDLPDLAARGAPRTLRITKPLDPTGKHASQKDLESAYAVARAAYKSAGAPENLILEGVEPETSK